MSHIVEFHVEGLAGKEKGFGKKLNRDVNVFFGLNGSGKTSLLKIFNAAFNSDPSTLVNVPFTKAEVVVESLAYKKQFRYSLDKASLKATHNQQVLFGEAPEEDNPQIFFEARAGRIVRHKRTLKWKVEPSLPKDFEGGWAHGYLPTTRLLYRRSFEPMPQELDEDFYDTFFAQQLERHWNEYFGSVQSQVRQIQERGIANILAEMISAKETGAKAAGVDWEEAFERVTTFLKRQKLSSVLPTKRAFRARFEESPVLQKVVARIDVLEGQIARTMETRTKLQALVERLFSGNKKLVLGDTSIEVRTKDNLKIGLQSLSSGEKHILRILFEVMRVGESSLIIDEPEISLHIDWQRELIKAIRELNPTLQLIVATHSPEVTAEIEDSKIFPIPA